MVTQSMTKFVDKLKIADGDTVYVVGLYYTVYYIEGNIGGGILGRMTINSPKQFIFWIKKISCKTSRVNTQRKMSVLKYLPMKPKLWMRSYQTGEVVVKSVGKENW